MLTKDADKLICLLYKNFLYKRKNGTSKSEASYFGSSHNIHEKFCSDLLFEDVDDTCRELDNVGFLNCLWADNIASEVYLTDDAIIYMENRFKNGLTELLGYIEKIKPW